jgi:hypothetical protein
MNRYTSASAGSASTKSVASSLIKGLLQVQMPGITLVLASSISSFSLSNLLQTYRRIGSTLWN